MQTLCLGMNMLKGRIELQWNSWMAGMERTTDGAGQEEQREGKPLLQQFPVPVIVFSRAHRASLAMAASISLSASALRPDLECCRQLGVM